MKYPWRPPARTARTGQDRTGRPEGEDGGRTGARGEDRATAGPRLLPGSGAGAARELLWLSLRGTRSGRPGPPRTRPEGRAGAARAGV